MDTATAKLSGLIIERRDGGNEAVYDEHRHYRYRLTRTWNPTGPRIGWVMLNPSTATASANDPTITRVVGFSRAWGFGSLEVVNLFALRTPDPAILRHSTDPVGPSNDRSIRESISSVDTVVAAWGNQGSLINPKTGASRDLEVRDLLRALTVLSLGATKPGQPRHPLYLPSSTQPVRSLNVLNR